MTKQQKAIIAVCVGLLALPMAGLLLKTKGVFPENFLNFPPLTATPKAGYNPIMITVLGVASVFTLMLYFVPYWFGFQRPPSLAVVEKHDLKLPFWFWLGLTVSIGSLSIIWGHLPSPKAIVYYGYVFTCAGLIFVVDGLVYCRNNGKSILTTHPRNLFFIGLSSSVGWMFYEYLSFFVEANWYYPNSKMISQLAFNIYAVCGAFTLVPLVFEIYTLLKTFPPMRKRFSYGPKFSLSRKTQIIILIAAFVPVFGLYFFPNVLFIYIWLGPAIIMSVILDMTGVWTPFKPIAQSGNWTPLALIALADGIQGFVWEMINYFSSTHIALAATQISHVPGYWFYSIPCVEVMYIFEMPFFGYFGYLPYGIYNWIWWLAFAHLFKISDVFDDQIPVK